MNAMIKKISRMMFFGFLIWFITFVISFFFYSKDKTLLIPLPLFKSLMIVIGSGTGAFFITHYFLSVKKRFFTNGIIIGVTWLLINLLLDMLILIPMGGYTFTNYIFDIGLRYLTIPITTITIGYIVEKMSNSAHKEGV